MKTLFAFLTVALLTSPLTAQDTPKAPTAKMAGDWDVSFTSPQGAATWRFKFEQSADTLWGTANTGDFGTVNVTDGWVNGNDVGFSLSLNFQGTAISLNFTGKVAGDTTQGQIDVPGVGIQPFPFTAVRVTGTGTGLARLSGSTLLAERPKSFALRSR